MKRLLPYLPLLGLAPLGGFLGLYLDNNAHILGGFGFFFATFSAVVLPWLVSGIFAACSRGTWGIRTVLFICALVVQYFLLFMFYGIDTPISSNNLRH